MSGLLVWSPPNKALDLTIGRLRRPPAGQRHSVRLMSDPRLDIWDVLHDGEITIMHREAPDVVSMFVSIPYVRRRTQPLGDSFRLRLGGFRGLLFSYDIDQKTFSEIDYIEGFRILNNLSGAMPAMIQLVEGKLMLDFDSLDLSLDAGQAATHEEVRRVARDYWDEFASRTK